MAHPLTKTLDLVRRAQGGDVDSMNRLLQRYTAPVRRAVRAKMGARLRARLETDDIVQPALAKAFQLFNRFEMRQESSLRHWLIRIAFNQLRDAADREARVPTAKVHLDDRHSDVSCAAIQIATTHTGPAVRVAHAERDATLRECLDQLPEQYRTVIVLREHEGLAWEEIARRMGKRGESSARDLHRRALLKLKVLLRRRGVRAEKQSRSGLPAPG